MGQRASHWLAIDCARTPGQTGLHGLGTREFERRYKVSEAVLLAITLQEVESFRLTHEQYTAMQERVKATRPGGSPRTRGIAPSASAGISTAPSPQRSVTYASTQRPRQIAYMVLRDEERRGKIEDLQIQVRFNLLPAQGRSARDYIADFVYTRDGSRVVEDVKSGPTKTREFMLKRKMMLFFMASRCLR